MLAAQLPPPIQAIEPYLNHYGYLVVGGFLLLENIGIPVIPGEATLIAGAVFAGTAGPHHLNVVLVGIVGVLACFVGAEGGYLIGEFGGRALVLRYGTYVFLRPHHLDRAERVVDRYGGLVVIIARFIIGLREFNGIIAGTTGMRWSRFMVYNAIGAVAWVACWVTLGYEVGTRIGPLYYDLLRYSTYVAIAAGVLIAALLVRAAFRRRRAMATAGHGTGAEPADRPDPAGAATPDPDAAATPGSAAARNPGDAANPDPEGHPDPEPHPDPDAAGAPTTGTPTTGAPGPGHGPTAAGPLPHETGQPGKQE